MALWEKSTEYPVPVEQLYAWHTHAGAFFRLTPPWENISVASWQGGEATQHLPPAQQVGDISKGAKVSVKMHIGPFPLTFQAEHVEHEENKYFVDEQKSGPFRSWRHTHRFVALPDGRSRMEDSIAFEMPFGVGASWVRSQLDRTFSYRHQRLAHDLQMLQAFSTQPRLRIAVTGSSGLIGQQLCSFLRCGGHRVHPVVRRPPAAGSDEIGWVKGQLDTASLEGVDAVIHLAGEPIAGRWTKSKKQRVYESREKGTHTLAKALASLKQPPKVLLSASAVGIYGAVYGGQEFTEESPPGDDFLASVCTAWEAAAEPARQAGIRVVHPRISLVLSAQGGALQKMLLPFSLGLGGPVGSGTQWMSWIHIDDLVGMFYQFLHDDRIQGPVNMTAPRAIQNGAFGKSLGRALRRPAVLPLPSFAVKMMFGEMGESLLLRGANVLPKVLQESNFQYFFEDIEEAFRFELGT